MSEITRVLTDIERGDTGATDRLLPLVYAELRQLAAMKISHEPQRQRHDATSLLHLAYLRLVGNDSQSQWDSRGHFFAAAAEAMRRILVEDARRQRRQKHGGGRQHVEIHDDCMAASSDSDELLALDEALTRFAVDEPAKAQLVKLRYFGGLSMEECASALGISLATAKRHWAYARACLFTALADDSG